jgi:hypothetical protein
MLAFAEAKLKPSNPQEPNAAYFLIPDWNQISKISDSQSRSDRKGNQHLNLRDLVQPF